MRLSSLSKKYVKTALSLKKLGVDVDLTGDTVEFGFVAGAGDPGQWYVGSWESYGGKQYARVLVGPGTTVGTLVEGSYWVHIRITDNPEIPVFRVPEILQVY